MQIVPLRKTDDCENIPATLRVIADEIEKGAHGDWPVTTCVVVYGHTQKETDGARYFWETHGLGPRCDPFTVRGLLALAINKLGGSG